MSTQNRERVELVCIGVAMTIEGKLAYIWRHAKAWNELDGQDLIYNFRRGSVRVGQVYSVEIIPESFADPAKRSVFKDTLRWARSWHDKAQSAQWEAEAEAKFVAHDAESKLAKDERASSELRKALEPVRRAYQNTNRTGQAALLAAVIMQIQRRTGIEEIE